MKRTVNISKTGDTADMNQYYWFDNAFTDDEITLIEALVAPLSGVDGKAGREGGETRDNVRSSTIKWIEYEKENEWLFQKMGEYINEANLALWNFDWEGHTDPIQYTEYHANKEGKYDWHIDIGNGSMSLRKISAVLILNDGYEGGQLQIRHVGEDLEGKKGQLYIFPSYLMHRVTPITKGMRKSLVIWVGGDHYR